MVTEAGVFCDYCSRPVPEPLKSFGKDFCSEYCALEGSREEDDEWLAPGSLTGDG